MNFLQKVKTDLQKIVKHEKSESVFCMSQEDVEMLALMCIRCIPILKQRKFIFSKYYSYYVPASEKGLSVVKSMFEKNGIQMQVHYSRILSDAGQNVLRTNLAQYKNSKDVMQVIKTMQIIKNNYIYLYSPQGKQKRQELYCKLSELRQNQK